MGMGLLCALFFIAGLIIGNMQANSKKKQMDVLIEDTKAIQKEAKTYLEDIKLTFNIK